MDYFDRHGDPVCYMADQRTLCLWDGSVAALLQGDLIHAFDGRFLGWSDGGWLYDRENRPALFGPRASGGPMRPMRNMRVERGLQQTAPAAKGRQPAPMRGARGQKWSPHSGIDYFQQKPSPG